MAIATPPSSLAAASKTSGAPLEVGETRWNDLLAFCLLNRSDLALLADSMPGTELIEGLPDAFYAHVLAKPDLRAIVEGHSTVDRLAQTLKRYFRTVFSGEFGSQRVSDIVRIGVVHDHIDLPIGAFIGAILQLDQVAIPGSSSATATTPPASARRCSPTARSRAPTSRSSRRPSSTPATAPSSWSPSWRSRPAASPRSSAR